MTVSFYSTNQTLTIDGFISLNMITSKVYNMYLMPSGNSEIICLLNTAAQVKQTDCNVFASHQPFDPTITQR